MSVQFHFPISCILQNLHPLPLFMLILFLFFLFYTFQTFMIYTQLFFLSFHYTILSHFYTYLTFMSSSFSPLVSLLVHLLVYNVYYFFTHFSLPYSYALYNSFLLLYTLPSYKSIYTLLISYTLFIILHSSISLSFLSYYCLSFSFPSCTFNFNFPKHYIICTVIIHTIIYTIFIQQLYL